MKRLVRIEYPGAVTDHSEIITYLGGEDAVTTVFCKPEILLQLRFAKSSPPLLSIQKPVTQLLFRKRKNSGIAEIIGVVETAYEFTRMVDFASTCRRDPDPSDPFCAAPVDIRLAPPVFSGEKEPLDYGFVDYEGSYGERDERKRRRETRRVAEVHGNEAVPTVAMAAEAPSGLEIRGKRLLAKLHEVFGGTRPVYTKHALIDQLKDIQTELDWKKDVVPLLPCVAYSFTSGPFRMTFVRLGYDPRHSVSGRLWQVVDLRLREGHGAIGTAVRPALPKRANATKMGSANASDSKTLGRQGEAASGDVTTPARWNGKQKLVKRMQLFQLCDLHDATLQKILESDCGRGSYHAVDGWLGDGVLGKLRAAMKLQQASDLDYLPEEDVKEDAEEGFSVDIFGAES